MLRKEGLDLPEVIPPPMCVFVMSKETLLPAQEDLGSKALETWKLEPFFFFFVLHSSGKELALERSAGGT